MSIMMIGDLARRTGTKVNTVRYYEEIGLLPLPARTASGRRTYAEHDVKRLSFIRNSRRFGFSIDEIRSLLEISEKPKQDCGIAAAIAKNHLARIETQLSQLEILRSALREFVTSCAGGSVQECGIISALCDNNTPIISAKHDGG